MSSVSTVSVCYIIKRASKFWRGFPHWACSRTIGREQKFLFALMLFAATALCRQQLFPRLQNENGMFQRKVELWQDTVSYRCRSCRISSYEYYISPATQDRKTYMPPTAPQTMLFGAILQTTSIFVSSKPFHIQLPPRKRQRSNTIDFQGKNHDPTSIGIPRKRGKCALWFQENRAASR